ncbi:MAG: hypothetical protein WCV93_01540 [Candidatus Shapirobacteria bacterium]|jgi:hypothetical protein
MSERIRVVDLPRGFTPTDVPVKVVKIGLGDCGVVVECPKVGVADVRLVKGDCGINWVSSPISYGDRVVGVGVDEVPAEQREEMWKGLLTRAREGGGDRYLLNALPELLVKLGYVWDGKTDFEGVSLRR